MAMMKLETYKDAFLISKAIWDKIQEKYPYSDGIPSDTRDSIKRVAIIELGNIPDMDEHCPFCELRRHLKKGPQCSKCPAVKLCNIYLDCLSSTTIHTALIATMKEKGILK